MLTTIGRWGAGALVVLAFVVAAASPASAASHLDCPSPHHCVVAVGSAPSGGAGGGDGGNGGVVGGGGIQTCDNPMHACYVVGIGWWNAADKCWYLNAAGDRYIRYCYVGLVQHDPVLGPPDYVTLPEPPDGFGGPPDPLVAAARAVNALDIAGPSIRLAPSSAGVGGLVGLPVWMSTQVTPVTWGTVTATASIPGLSATATATPEHITWDMGDGHSVVCANPGTPYRGEATTSPDCGYRYAAPSDRRPNGRYTVTATTTWRVTWTATDGAHGWVTVDAASTTTEKISDLQVVIR